MTAERQRLHSRNHKRRRAARRYADERARSLRCPWRMGRAVCGALLERDTDRNGRLVTRCPKCERREVGLCQFCPKPVYGMVRKSLYCAEHKRAMHCAHRRGYYARHRDEKLPAWRARMRVFRATHPASVQKNRETVRARRRERKLRILRGASRAA